MESGDRIALTAFVSAAILGGGNVIAVKFSNFELHPLWGASIRFVLAALLLWGIVLLRKTALPRGRRLLMSAGYGVLFFGFGFAFAFYALVDLDPGFASIILATGPLLTLLFAVAHRQEALRLSPVIGSLSAVAGITVMSTVNVGSEIPILSVLAMVGAAACFSEASVIARGIMPIDPSSLNAVGMTTGAVALLAGALIVRAPFAVPEELETWTAMAYMVVLGSVVLFNLVATALRYWDASRVAYMLVLMPIVAVVLSIWIFDETLGIGLIGGGLLVLMGVYVGALRRPNPGR
jgi:drug/metabolite transporter (DMT)-like permease